MARKKKKVSKCYRCGKEITFSPARKSKYGNWIPQDYPKGGNHDCPLSDYSKRGKSRDKTGDEHGAQE